ncbi:hypothetical protein CHARACLAT_025260 [Characodon lateralis]|uniref:Uncharacterized protein n=1 Tax=Characodon lateralis TaxID=208331 RepID=A0ABU7ECR1_9TELE|nr:hypothetical protein [Characodon lateralis]
MVRQNTDGEEETAKDDTTATEHAHCFLILEDQEHPGWKCDWAEASMKLPEMLTHTVIAPGSPPQHVTAV